VIACRKILVRLLFVLSLLSLLLSGAIPAAAGSAPPPAQAPTSVGARVRLFASDLTKQDFSVWATPGDVSPAKVTPPASSRSGVAQPASDPFTEGLIDSLKKSGFRVSQGYPKLYTLQDCIHHTYPILKNCFLANPAAPYVVPVVKTWRDEYVDPATVNAFVETDPGYSVTYRLDPRDAILLYGQMPPPGRYMGLQTWEFSEDAKWKPKDYYEWANTPGVPFPIQYLFDTIPPDDPKSHRVISLSALGDVVNNVVMERKSGYPFEQTRYFIITPSATTDRAVRRELQRQGVSDGLIFTEEIPSRDKYGPIGPLGMNKDAIDFVSALRYTVPNPGYELAASAWRSNPPLTVLRVRAPAYLGPVRRYGSLTFEGRTAANSEADLKGDLQDLVAAVCNTLSSHTSLTSTDCTLPPPKTSYIPELVRDFGWTGPYCRSIAMDCLADQQEAALYFASPRSLGAEHVIAVIGTLATETRNATYVALSANDASMMAGVSNVLDSDIFIPPDVHLKGLKGSADGFAATVNNASLFFVHYFAKDCAVLGSVPGAAENCSPTDVADKLQGDPALRDKFIISVREYIAPGSQRGPDPSKLLAPRILTFTQP
jgi:hypothetical protein